jgi:beta-lactamase regulating signal transducer with metallopeptidase domain
MYALRGLAICFSTFFLVYLTISAAVILAWSKLWRSVQKRSPRIGCNLLFSLRISPLVLSILVTLLFAAPSFVIFEPRAVNEPIGRWLPVLAFSGLAVIAAGLWNAATALRGISVATARWASGASTLTNPAIISKQIMLLRTTAVAPPLTAAGVFRARVWLSSTAEQVLTESELHSALRHELVHVCRRDNLRKLFLRLVAFPGMAKLESAWREATEMAADDGAVSSAVEALDLAAAVIKLSRLNPLVALPAELATSLVHSPAQSLNARVSRLLEWSENRENRPHANWRKSALWAAATLTTLVLTYTHLLLRVHAATELLVR